MKIEVTLQSCSNEIHGSGCLRPTSTMPLDRSILLLQKGVFGTKVHVDFEVVLGPDFEDGKYPVHYTISAEGVQDRAILEGLLSEKILKNTQTEKSEK